MWGFPFNMFPGTNMHDLDLDWILKVVRDMDIKLNDFITNFSNPKIAYSYAEFTNKKLIYLYVGDEFGYETNHWYYFNADTNAWTDGGLYGSAVVDTELDEDSTNAVQNRVIAKTISDMSVYVTPEMFGAVGDDINDDTAALKEMFLSNMPVYLPEKTYLTTEELVYAGQSIAGSGTIRSIMPVEHVIRCTSDEIEICGIHVDCHNMSAIGIYCIGNTMCNIHDCIVENTENAELGSVACSGIYTTGYYSAKIENNKILHINRTNQNAGVISSTGINCSSDGCMYISNNFINDVKCSTQQNDCDGIYLTSPANTAMAYVTNNIILDPTGRFIKLQTNNANVIGNRGRLINSASGLFFKGIDFQYGGGLVENNYIDLAGKAGASSMFFHSDYNQNYGRVLSIKDNTCICSNEINSFLMIDGTVGGSVNIENNSVFTTYINYVLRFSETTHATKIRCVNNTIPFYRLINANGTADYTNIVLTVEDNKSTYSGNQIFNNAVSINNIIVRNNIGVNERLTNVTMNFTAMDSFSVEYNQVGVPITNAPAALAAADHVMLTSMSGKTYMYYNYSDGTSGVSQK